MSMDRRAAASGTRWRPRVLIACLLLAGLAGAAFWVGSGLRDRHPGYDLDLYLAPGPVAEPLHVGFGRRRITPDLSRADHPVFLAGFAHNRRATRVHDDLWAVAVVIDDGTHRIGLVALDAIGLFHDDVIEIRTRVQALQALDYVIVASTHDHSAPDLMGLWGPTATRTGVDEAYRALVLDAAAHAIEDAVAALVPAQVTAREIPLTPEGLVTDTRPPVVFDPNLRVLHFTAPDTGVTIGSIVGWADHPETPWADNTEVTADFPGYLRDALERGLDPANGGPALGGTHLYVNGAIGGLMTTTPETAVADPVSGRLYAEPSHDKARALGRRLAARVLHELATRESEPEARPTLSVTARTFELPLDNQLLTLASALRVIVRGQPTWRHIRSEVALVQLGEASLLCLPGEAYPEIVNGGVTHPDGADFDIDPVELPPLRSLLPGRVKFVVGLANDEIGYIIPKSQWDARAPWTVQPAGPYGEMVSPGPETGPTVYRAAATVIRPPSPARPRPLHNPHR